MKPYKENSALHENAGFNNFVTRSVDRLMDGNKELRFISINTPNLAFNEDPRWHRITVKEIEESFQTIKLIGGNVTRSYVFTLKGADGAKYSDYNGPFHINDPTTCDYGEELFQDFDKMLELANRYQVRVIIPFVDEWNYWGSYAGWAAFRGKEKKEFAVDLQVKQDFKNFISFVLNRKNVYTGIRYKDDKAILAWELGNELMRESIPDSWISEMAGFIKHIDSNHLVMSGRGAARTDVISEELLADPNVDILEDHYYGGDYTDLCNKERELCKNKKVFTIIEYGPWSDEQHLALLDTVISNGTSGAMIWSLRVHRPTGGWNSFGNPFLNAGIFALRYPGFASGDDIREINNLKIVSDYAYKIKGEAKPALPIPGEPFLLETIKPEQIAWYGSIGAESYRIERAEAAIGPWEVIADNVSDSSTTEPAFFADTSVEFHKKYFYRIKAENSSGASGHSNIVGPVSTGGMFIDATNNFSKILSHTENIIISNENQNSFDGAKSRFKRSSVTSECIVYSIPYTIQSFCVTTYNSDPCPDFNFYVSSDNDKYTRFKPVMGVKSRSDKDRYFKQVYYSDNIPPETKYLKIEWADMDINHDPQISQVNIGYE